MSPTNRTTSRASGGRFERGRQHDEALHVGEAQGLVCRHEDHAGQLLRITDVDAEHARVSGR